jgi:hypothetical protein
VEFGKTFPHGNGIWMEFGKKTKKNSKSQIPPIPLFLWNLTEFGEIEKKCQI